MTLSTTLVVVLAAASIEASPGSPTVRHARALASAPFADELDASRVRLIAALEELANVAQKGKMYLQRDRFYQTVLDLDPEHATARKTLGYKKAGDGAWRRDRYRPPTDRGKPEVLDALDALKKEKLAELKEEFLAALHAASLKRDALEREVKLYLLLDADDADLHAELGEIRGDDGVWRDAETVATKTRREELEDLVHDARKEVPKPEPWEMSADEASIEVKWTAKLRTPLGLVAGTVKKQEVEKAAETVQMLDAFLRAAIPPPSPAEWTALGLRAPAEMYSRWLSKYRVYLLGDPAEIPSLLAHWNVSQQEQEQFAKLATVALDAENSLGVWTDTEAKRLDALTRQVVGGYLRSRFAMSPRQGWVWEGLGMYLTNLAVGTRLTFFVQPETTYVGDVTAKLDLDLMEAGADWLAALVDMMRSGEEKPPDIKFTVTSAVSAMDFRQLLFSYGLAAYLLEAHPEKLPTILARVGANGDSVKILEETLGMPIDEVQADVVRWAAKMNPPAAGEDAEGE